MSVASAQLREAEERYGVVVSGADFAGYVDGAVESARLPLEQLCVRDLALAFACLRKDAAALRALDAHVIAPLGGELARLVPDAADRDDVLQQLRTRLLVGSDGKHGQLASYRGAGALKAWARVIATRIALNAKRGGRARETPLGSAGGAGDDDDDEIASAAFDGDPELAAMKRDRKEELKRAVRAAFASLTVRERNVLRQSYVDGLSIDELGALYQVHRATAARWIGEARERVWAETRRVLVESTQGSRAEAEQVMAFLQSRLDITLGGLLR